MANSVLTNLEKEIEGHIETQSMWDSWDDIKKALNKAAKKAKDAAKKAKDKILPPLTPEMLMENVHFNNIFDAMHQYTVTQFNRF